MDGGFYGVCPGGGRYDRGSVFRLGKSGKFRLLHSFRGSDGAQPGGALVQGFDGNLYGITSEGGSSGVGTLFKISPEGELTSLYQFGSGGPLYPLPGLTLAPDGTIFGIYALFESGLPSAGGLFTISPSGAINFPSYFEAEPLTSPPVPGAHGDLYAFNQPTVFVGKETVTVEAVNPASEFANIVENLPAYSGSDFINFAGGAIQAGGRLYVNATSIIENPTEPYYEVEADPTTQGATFFNLQPYGSSPGSATSGKILIGTAAGAAISAATFTVE
jgi:uncharacterized repeat protein (TIGR03803 family)